MNNLWIRRLTEFFHISKAKSSYHIERSRVETEIISKLINTINKGISDYLVRTNKACQVPYKFTGWYLHDFTRLRYAIEHQLYVRADEGYRLGNSIMAGGKIDVYSVSKDKAGMPLVRYKLQLPLVGLIYVDIESVCRNEYVSDDKRQLTLFKKTQQINKTSLVNAKVVVHVSRLDTVDIEVPNLSIRYYSNKDVSTFGWSSIEHRKK